MTQQLCLLQDVAQRNRGTLQLGNGRLIHLGGVDRDSAGKLLQRPHRSLQEKHCFGQLRSWRGWGAVTGAVRRKPGGARQGPEDRRVVGEDSPEDDFVVGGGCRL